MDSPSEIQILAVFVGSFGLGAVFITAAAVERTRMQIILTLFYSLFGAALFAFGNSRDAGDLPTTIPAEAQANLALIAHSTTLTFLIVAFATLALARLLFSRAPEMREDIRKIIVPERWKSPNAIPPAPDDFEKRWYVTFAAATGSIIGMRLTEPKAVDVIMDSITPSRLFITAFLTVVVIVLFGPGEEFILGASLKPSPEHSTSRSHFEELLHNSSGRSWFKVLFVFLCFAAFNIAEKCMDDSLSSGHAQAALEMLLSAAPAGVVTYYWCAGIQRGAKTVADVVLAPTLLIAVLLMIGAILFVGFDGAYQGYLAVSVKFGVMGALILSVVTWILLTVLIFLFFFLLLFLQYGIVAAAGGVVIDIDRAKPGRSPFLTVAKVIGLVLAIQVGSYAMLIGVLNFVLKFAGKTISDDATYSGLLFVVGTLVWGLGLIIAGFPKVLARGRGSPSGASAQVASSE